MMFRMCGTTGICPLRMTRTDFLSLMGISSLPAAGSFFLLCRKLSFLILYKNNTVCYNGSKAKIH